MCVSKRVYCVKTTEGEYKKFLCNCGKCLECLSDISRQWALRCDMETEYYKVKYNKGSCCITLTYAETDGQLSKEDINLFLKRLRYYVATSQDVRITYFLSGEYGSINSRPHFHVLVFGFCPDDMYVWKKGKKGSIQYRSPFVEKMWDKGFVTVGNVTKETAFYACKYLQKLALTNDSKVAPFVRMSKRDTMIGYRYFKEYCKVDEYGKFFYKGQRYSLPRTFYKGVDESFVKQIKQNKYQENAFNLYQDSICLESDWRKNQKVIEKEQKYEVQRKKADLQTRQDQKNACRK